MDTRSKVIGWTVGIATWFLFVYLLAEEIILDPPTDFEVLFIYVFSGVVGYLAAMFAWEGKGPGRGE